MQLPVPGNYRQRKPSSSDSRCDDPESDPKSGSDEKADPIEGEPDGELGRGEEGADGGEVVPEGEGAEGLLLGGRDVREADGIQY